MGFLGGFFQGFVPGLLNKFLGNNTSTRGSSPFSSQSQNQSGGFLQGFSQAFSKPDVDENKEEFKPIESTLSKTEGGQFDLQSIVDAASAAHSNPIMARLAASQAVLESRLLGKPSSLATKYNNLFGIKKSGTGGSVNLQTREVINGRSVQLAQPFSVNKTLTDSFTQHRSLLERLGRYQPVIESQSLSEAFDAIGRSGYATDPQYSAKLKKIYNSHLRPLFGD